MASVLASDKELLFVRRLPELLALEGWYKTPTYEFKLSCRFNDILRCSEFNGKPEHFTSCFRKGMSRSYQPGLRCADPAWGIIYTPDKHGNFLGRAFVHLEKGVSDANPQSDVLVVDKIYGNRLKFEDIKMTIRNVDCRDSQRDTYLVSKPS